MRFIAFDLETTGTVPGIDRIVELGAVRFINGQVDAIFSTLIQPGIPIPPAASAVNKITNDMVLGKPKVDEVLESFAEFCGEDHLVAHNAPFDSQFLISDFKKFEFATPAGIVLDTLPMARKVFPGMANYRLGTLIQHLKLESKSEFHRAEEDATYCGNLFLEIVKRVSVNGQAPAVTNLIALTGKPEFRFPKIEKKPKQLDFLAMM